MTFCSRFIGKMIIAAVGCAVLGLPAAAASHLNAALVKVPIASLYAAPSDTSERVTQVLFCTPLVCLAEKGPWVKVMVGDQYRTEHGYPGWILRRHLSFDTTLGGVWSKSDFAAWSNPEAKLGKLVLMVIEPRVALHSAPEQKSPVTMTVYAASRLQALSFAKGWYKVALPDSPQPAYVQASQVVEGYLAYTTGRDFLESAKLFCGTPYLWGGMSAQGIDCSGLIYVVARLHGLLIPRDADQQSTIGKPIAEKDLQPGDLIFYGESPEAVTHVGYYAGNGQMLDAFSKRGVSVRKFYYGRIVGARRL